MIVGITWDWIERLKKGSKFTGRSKNSRKTAQIQELVTQYPCAFSGIFAPKRAWIVRGMHEDLAVQKRYGALFRQNDTH
jgi:hypothetical protein